jgi:hypothetical protein
MINRCVVLLKLKQPMLDWISNHNGAQGAPADLKEINIDRTAYLISPEDGEDHESFDNWLKDNFQDLFLRELSEWIIDETDWPECKDLKMFQEWFDVELHTIVLDLGTDPIEDDGEDDEDPENY